MLSSPSASLAGADLGQPRAVADEEEDDVVAVAEPPGGLEELVERVGQAEVARVHRDELVRQPERLAERVALAGHRVDLVAAAPDRDRREPVGPDPLGGDPVGHVRAEHDDLVGLPVDRRRSARRARRRPGCARDIRPSARLASGWRSMLQ